MFLNGYDYWKTTDVLGEMYDAYLYKLSSTKDHLRELFLQDPIDTPLDLQYCYDVYGLDSDEFDSALSEFAKSYMVNHNESFCCY